MGVQKVLDQEFHLQFVPKISHRFNLLSLEYPSMKYKGCKVHTMTVRIEMATTSALLQ